MFDEAYLAWKAILWIELYCGVVLLVLASFVCMAWKALRN